jgi:single-strand DNA-binding protein
MPQLNKVFLMGNLTRDPELRYTSSGVAVTDLRLATSRTWTGKDGERKEETLFIDVTVWNRQAENCCQYLKKGRPVHVEGYLKSESWEDKTTGKTQSKIKVEAERVQFLDGRRDDSGGSHSSDEDYVPREPQVRRPPSGPGNGPGRGGYPTAAGSADRRSAPSPEPEGDVDDIPF